MNVRFCFLSFLLQNPLRFSRHVLGSPSDHLGAPLGLLCAPWRSLESSAVLGDLLKHPEGPSRTANHAQGTPNGSPKRPLSTPRDPPREPSRLPGSARESPGTDLRCQGAPQQHLEEPPSLTMENYGNIQKAIVFIVFDTFVKEAVPQGCLEVHCRIPRTSMPRKAVPVVAP